MSPLQGVVLDMEGVLHVDWRPIEGSAEAVTRLAGAGVGVAVLTNTTGRTRAGIAARLMEMGMPIPAGQIVTAAFAAGEHLRRHHPGARVHALVEPDIATELEGLDLVEDAAGADVILLGGPDGRWTYDRLNAAFRRLLEGVPLVAMQRNRWWPTAGGPSLDAGAFVAGLEYAAGIEATVVGKPSLEIFAVACERAGAAPDEAAMVGDDLDSDLLPARELGMRIVLVRTGKGGSFSPGPGGVDLDAPDLAVAVDRLLS
ncbi:MAG TPA: HAD-IIA family hydrolase [Gaiellales bacterium]|jgi:HAD superfamily hydrolase (TIGR01458 family)|nr:HAD-IIA family hydrolase [Gaiellales bacterium]